MNGPIRRGIYVVPSLFTLANLAAGMLAILAALQGQLTQAAWLIILGIALDMMDGRLARWAGASSQFGMELDSLADLVTFGVAPAIVMFELALVPLGRPGFGIAVFFPVAAALRLARFNLRARAGEAASHFTGLPVPAAAGILASFVLSYELFGAGEAVTVKTIPLLMKRMPMFFHAVPLTMVILAFLMISKVQYGNFKQLKLGRPHSLQALGLLLAGLFLLLSYPQNMMFVLFCLYVLSGLAALGWRTASAQRAKRLAKLRRRHTDWPLEDRELILEEGRHG